MNLTLQRETSVTQAEADINTPFKVCFVCTGNTCRSPMAEGLFKKMLIDKNAALSGEAMKQLNYRQPDIYDALKRRLLKLGDKVGLGSIVKVNKYY